MMQFSQLNVAVELAKRMQGLVVLEAPDGNYVVTQSCHVKVLKKQGYVDVRERDAE